MHLAVIGLWRVSRLALKLLPISYARTGFFRMLSSDIFDIMPDCLAFADAPLDCPAHVCFVSISAYLLGTTSIVVSAARVPMQGRQLWACVFARAT